MEAGALGVRRAGRDRSAVALRALAAACLPVFVGALDLTVVSAVLPAVLVDLRLPLQDGLADASWAVSGYLAAYVFGLLVMGNTSDRLGRARAFAIALAIFSAGSIASAASPDVFGEWVRGIERSLGAAAVDPSISKVHALVAGRVVQGAGAGALVPVAMAVAADLFVGARAAAIGAVAAADMAGWVLGHLYGGLVVQAFPWPVLFWVNVPLAALSALVAWSALTGLPPADPRAPSDRLGAFLLGSALAGLTLVVGGNELSGPSSLARPVGAPAYAVPAGLIGGLALAAFIGVERRARAPLVDVRSFAGGGALLGASNFALGFCLMVGLVSVPLLVNVAAATPRQGALASGELLALLTIPLAVAAIPGGALSARFGTRLIVGAGFGAAVAGFAMMSRWDVPAVRELVAWASAGGTPTPAAGLAAIALAVVGVGLGLTTAPLAAGFMDRAPGTRRGSTAGLVIALRLLGMAVSAALLTSFGLRRLSAVAQARSFELVSADPSAVAEVGRSIAVQVSGEMALIAVGGALVGLAAHALRPAS